jgi:CRP-like cAMP-binding protein/DNA-binding NarL/FixJ family response regulator
MSSPSILIVEDEDIVAADIQEALESFGYSVCARAKTGTDAISLAKDQCPNLVLMDIKLQGEMDGVEASASIRKTLNIPVVFLTAYADDKTLERAKITEPYGYILKPFKEMELKMAVELALYKFGVEHGHDEEPIDSESIDLTPKKREVSDFLKRIEPFSQADDRAIDELAKVSRLTEHKTNDLIVFEGDEEVSGFVVFSGRVSLVKASPNGKELIVELLPPGDPFGLLTSFDDHPFPLSIKAQIDSKLLWIPRCQILLFLEKNPELGKKFIGEVFARLRTSHDFSRALAHDRVEARIAHALVSTVPKFCPNPEKNSEPLVIEMSRQEMAELVGTTPETVIRSMKLMEKDKLIDLSETGLVKVLDIDTLTELSES